MLGGPGYFTIDGKRVVVEMGGISTSLASLDLRCCGSRPIGALSKLLIAFVDRCAVYVELSCGITYAMGSLVARKCLAVAL